MSETTTDEAPSRPEIPTGIRLHKGGRVVAEGILEYIDLVYSVVTIKKIRDNADLPPSFKELKENQQFAKVHEVLEKLYPKTNANPVITWVGRISVEVDGEWKIIEGGNREASKGKSKKRLKFSRKVLTQTAINKRTKEEFFYLLRAPTTQEDKPQATSHVSASDSDSDIEERSSSGSSPSSPLEIVESPSEPTNPVPFRVTLPTGIRFLKKQEIIAEGQLLFVDSQYSAVKLNVVADREDIPQSAKDLKGVTISRIGLFLDLVFPRSNHTYNRWAGRIVLNIDGEWEPIRFKEPGVTEVRLTREHLIKFCVNTHKREQFSHLGLTPLSLKRALEENSTERSVQQETTEPAPKRRKRSRNMEYTNLLPQPAQESRSSLQSPSAPPSPPPSSSSSYLTSPPPVVSDHANPVMLVLDKLKHIDNEIKRRQEMMAQLQEEMRQLEGEKDQFRQLFAPFFSQQTKPE